MAPSSQVGREQGRRRGPEGSGGRDRGVDAARVVAVSRARRTSWAASELRLPARAQSGFGSQGSWAGGSPRRAISSVQVSCRRRSSSSVSLSTTSRRVCPSTALILCTTWGRRVWDRVTAGTAGSTRAAAPPRAGPGRQAGHEPRQRWAAGPRDPPAPPPPPAPAVASLFSQGCRHQGPGCKGPGSDNDRVQLGLRFSVYGCVHVYGLRPAAF